MFYLVGCLIGLGFFACSYAVVPVIVNEWFVEKNGFVMGAAAACGGIVAMVLSLVFPAVIESAGWEAGYVLLGIVVFALTTPVGIFLLKSSPADIGLTAFGAKESEVGATGKGPQAFLTAALLKCRSYGRFSSLFSYLPLRLRSPSTSPPIS